MLNYSSRDHSAVNSAVPKDLSASPLVPSLCHSQNPRLHDALTQVEDKPRQRHWVEHDTWDGHNVLGADSGHKCKMVTMNREALDGASPPRMCIREYADIVSTSVQQHGFWADCLHLSKMWTSLPDRSAQYALHGRKGL